MKPPKILLLIAPEFTGEHDPGEPLTDQEWLQYFQKIDQLETLFSKVIDLFLIGVLSLDEYTYAIERLKIKSNEMQHYRDRIAKEIDDRPSSKELERFATQYNLGLFQTKTRTHAKRKRTFRNKLERIFFEESIKRSKAK